MRSLSALTHSEQASPLPRVGCQAFLPPSLSDTLLKARLIMGKNFLFLLAVAQGSLVCPGLCFWLVSLGALIWSCAFISLCPEAVLEIILLCPASVILTRHMAHVCLHPELPDLPVFQQTPEPHVAKWGITGRSHTFLCFTVEP